MPKMAGRGNENTNKRNESPTATRHLYKTWWNAGGSWWNAGGTLVARWWNAGGTLVARFDIINNGLYLEMAMSIFDDLSVD